MTAQVTVARSISRIGIAATLFSTWTKIPHPLFVESYAPR